MAPKYSEEDLQNAIQLVKDGLSYRKAADKYGIPPTTLRMRCKNQQSRKEAFAPYQRISPAQEEALASWIRVQAALGFPVTHQQIRYLAQKLSDIRGNTSRVGKRWVKGFLARNDRVATQRAKRVDSSRINGATKEVIAGFYDQFEIPEIKAIKPKYRYNKDEMGLMEGQGRNGLVVGCAEYKGVIKRSPGSRTWTTFIECINAIGECLPPLVIFKGKSVQKQWFPRNLKLFEEWKFHATNNGWTDDETGLEWLHKIFLPLTKPEDPDDWRLLILDGHNSHTTAAYMWECFTHKVYLLYLPPHCSHVVQPLDLGVFSSAKQRYRSLLSESTQYSDSTIVGKRLLLKCYWLAHQEAFTPQNIKSGFRATGIWPFNRQKGLRSPLLLENTTKRSILKPTKSGVAPVTPKPKKVVFTTPGPWKTPMKAINLTI